MSARKPKQATTHAQPAPTVIPPEMGVVIEAQRQQLFRASAVIDVCRYASASKFEGFDPELYFDALYVVDRIIDNVAGVLEQYADDEAVSPEDDL